MRVVFALLIAVLLSACADPYQVSNIRPGVGSDDDLDALRPPSGVTFNYSVIRNDQALPAALSLTSKRINSTTYDYIGSIVFQLPGSVGDIRKISQDIAKVFGTAAPKIRNNRVYIPVRVRTDNRFRGRSSTLLAGNDRYVPHDCIATLGRCEYQSIDARGRKAPFTVETTETGGVWRATTQSKIFKSLKRQMVYSLDRNGVLLDMAITGKRNGEVSTMSFLRQGYGS